MSFSEDPPESAAHKIKWPPRPSLWTAPVAAAYFLFCLLLQAATGAWQANFVTYSDEPAHFIGAVMVKDWLLSGQWFTPVQFALDFYHHCPFFAVGYWPPFFYLTAASQFLVAGVGRTQALLLIDVFAAATACLLYRMLWPRTGFLAAFCAGALFLSLPAGQMSLCAVMADDLTTCLCLAAGVALVRYLKQPGFRNGIVYGMVAASAILTKYSAAYFVVLPLAALVVCHRTGWLRKPGFLIQSAIIALTVGPWVLWTRKLAFIGQPPTWPALDAARALACLSTTFAIFPPVLLAVVVPGLLALLLLPEAWGEDALVLALLSAGHLSLLFFAPVAPEPRYVILPAAALLVLSFMGWTAALRRIPARQRWARAFPFALAALTLAFVSTYFGRYSRPAKYPIPAIVDTVRNNHAWTGQRVVVPSDLEGAFLAEFVAEERHRPASYLLRPSKMLADSDWFGHSSSLFHTPAEMLEFFQRNPVTLVIWHQRPDARQAVHEHILGEMLRDNPLFWHRVASFGQSLEWVIYEWTPLRGSPN